MHCVHCYICYELCASSPATPGEARAEARRGPRRGPRIRREWRDEEATMLLRVAPSRSRVVAIFTLLDLRETP